MIKGLYQRNWAWGMVVFLAAAVAGLLTDCGSRTKTGKLVGIRASFGLGDALDGTVDKADFGGVVVVELKDGTQVDAVWDKALGSNIVGGMELEVEPTKDPKYWKVVKIISTPPGKKG